MNGQSTKARAKAMFRAGMSIDRVANELHVSTATIRHIRMEYDHEMTLNTGAWNDEDKIAMIECLKRGMTYVEIGRILHRKTDSVRAKARNLVGGKPRKRFGYVKWTPERKRELVDLYEGGESETRLAKRYHVTRRTIHDILHRTRIELGVVEDPAPDPLMPKHPGCQCGYCPHFKDARPDAELGIAGTCKVLNETTGRGDFCTAPEKPPQNEAIYPILFKERVVWHK